MPQKYISEMNESMKRRVASGMRENVYWVRASVIPVGVHGDLASERGNSHERKREEWLGKESARCNSVRFFRRRGSRNPIWGPGFRFCLSR